MAIFVAAAAANFPTPHIILPHIVRGQLKPCELYGLRQLHAIATSLAVDISPLTHFTGEGKRRKVRYRWPCQQHISMISIYDFKIQCNTYGLTSESL